jgi:hypothetical protein
MISYMILENMMTSYDIILIYIYMISYATSLIYIMISYMISCMHEIRSNTLAYDIVYDVFDIFWYHKWGVVYFMISNMISPLPSTRNHAAALAGADISLAIRTDHDSDSQVDQHRYQRGAWLCLSRPLWVGRRHPDSCYSFETHSRVHEHSWHWANAARHSSAAACGDSFQDYAGGNWTWMLPVSSPRENTFFKSTSVNTIPTQLNWKILYKESFTIQISICIQWECELYSGRPKARCYPFNQSGHCFRGKNSQVLHIIWLWCTWYPMKSYMISL